MNPKEQYILLTQDNQYNTSYPLSPEDWTMYRSELPLDFSSEQELSLYIHIPFCKQLCSFCEYTKMICPSEALQMQYIETVERDVESFLDNNQFILRGFDIGGGTPTALSDNAFERLMAVYDKVMLRVTCSQDFEPSIESTFETCTEAKVKRVVQSGIKRMSLGVQSSSQTLLRSCHRVSSDVTCMASVMRMLKEAGIEKVNLDLMYGLTGQTMGTLKSDIVAIRELHPEQVTLYELRTNQLAQGQTMTAEELYAQYCYLYDELTALGYIAAFGQNTFSMDERDLGVSSYLRSRMLEKTAYKGFGISAQSMCNQGVGYNVGKNATNIRELLSKESFEHGDTYQLPQEEVLNKYIAIAGYCNLYSKVILQTLTTTDEHAKMKERISFLLADGLLAEDKTNYFVTRKGFIHYGAINAMIRL